MRCESAELGDRASARRPQDTKKGDTKMFRSQLRDAREEGFTLIELLVVIIVLGILAGIVVFGVSTFKNDANVAACKADVKQVNTASDAYYAKNNAFAASIAALATAGYLKAAPASPDYTVDYAVLTGVASSTFAGCS
jgi:prepilin-type N-terminal cleavage/methylation domain-containing protein